MVSGYKRILIICRRHIAVSAVELACCGLLPLVVEVRIYCVVGCDQEVHILRACADHLAGVLCAVELLLLVQLHACAKLCVVTVDGVVVLYISATHPAAIRKELCLLVVAAADDAKRVEQQLQRSALRVPRHLVVRDDLCDCAFGSFKSTHLVTHLQRLADGSIHLDAALGIRHIRDCTGCAVLPCLGNIGEDPLAECTWRGLSSSDTQNHRISRLQHSAGLDHTEVVQLLQLLLCILSGFPCAVQLLGRTDGLVLVHACLVHDRVTHLLRSRLRQRTGILVRSTVIAHVAYTQVPACSCNAVVVSVVGRRQQLPLRNLVTGLDLHVVGQPALRIGREVVVQVHRAFRAVVVQHVDSVLANSFHHTWLLCPLCAEESAKSRRHVLAGLLVKCTDKRSLTLLERDSLCSVLAVMCDDAVRNCVHVVVAVDVDHHSRCRHLFYVDNGLQDDIVPASLYGKQVQGSVDSVIRKHCVSEVGVRIYLREHERNTVANGGIGKPQQPVITCDVLCDCIQSLEEGIEEDAGVASVEREHALRDALVLLVATDVLRNPVPEDAVLDVAPGLLFVRVYRVVNNAELCKSICDVLSLVCFRIPVADEREPDSCSHYLQRGAKASHKDCYLSCDGLACYSCTSYRNCLEHCSGNKHALFEL